MATTNPSDFITPVSGLQYYVCMVDYGRGRARPNGFGANVEPENTREDIILEVVEDIREGRSIVHVKFVDGNDIQDVTHEIVRAALERLPADAPLSPVDRQSFAFDHARDLLKHGAF